MGGKTAMEAFMMEFLMMILKWAGIFIIIMMGLGVLLAIVMTLFLIRLLWSRSKTSEDSSEEYVEDDYDH